MAQEYSFDVTCGYDKQELANALDQARREISQRYDFKGVLAEIEESGQELILHTESDYKLAALIDLIESKLIKRNVPLSVLDKTASVEPASGGTVRQKIRLIDTLTTEQAKEISKEIRSHLPKVKSTIQGDTIRVSSKSKDELQEVMALLRERFTSLPLTFTNYR